MIDWGRTDLATTLGIPKEKVRFLSPYVGGGFGGKLFLRTDAVWQRSARRAAGRPVKVAMHASVHGQQHDSPSSDAPAYPDRRDPGRHDHGDRP